MPDRKEQSIQPSCLQSIEEITLILVRIGAFFENRFILKVFDPCIMSCRHVVHAFGIGNLNELANLYSLVATHAGVWCSPACIGGDEIVDDGGAELLT